MSGIILPAEPPSITPRENTDGVSFTLSNLSYKAVIILLAISKGFTLPLGSAACPPLPITSIYISSAEAINIPLRIPMTPLSSSGETC